MLKFNLNRLKAEFLGRVMDKADRKLVAVSRLFYEQLMSKTDIANELNISITHVNRLLKEAARRGVVQIKIQAPNFEDLELELKEKYGLRDAVVIQGSDEKFLHTELGIAAAQYFEDKVEESSKIGFGSGRTMFEMASAIPEKARRLTLYPIAVYAEQTLRVESVDANTVVNILWFKSRPDSEAYRLELFFPGELISKLETKVRELLKKDVTEELINEISNLDYYFFSCSHLRENSQLLALTKSCGEDLKGLRESGVIGDYLFNTINERGEFVPNCAEKFIFRITLEALRAAAQNKNRKVVLVAGGKDKAGVVRAGISQGFFNALITDSETAQALLERKI